MEQPTFHAQAAGREQSFGEAAVRKALRAFHCTYSIGFL